MRNGEALSIRADSRDDRGHPIVVRTGRRIHHSGRPPEREPASYEQQFRTEWASP